jgi:hypothetical protein
MSLLASLLRMLTDYLRERERRISDPLRTVEPGHRGRWR